MRPDRFLGGLHVAGLGLSMLSTVAVVAAKSAYLALAGSLSDL